MHFGFTFKILGVRSLTNASRARQFNPLNPPGVGWVPLPQTNMAAVVGRARSVMRGRAWSCVVVRGRAWSCVVVHGRSCAVVRGRARSCVVVRGRAWSCVVVRGRAWSCVVVRGRAWSCVVVRGRAWSCVVVRGRAWSCVVVRGRAWSCVAVRGRARSVVRGRAWSCVVVRGRACVVGHSWSFMVIRGRAWSCAVGRAWSCAVGRAWSCVVVPFCPLRGQHGSQHYRAARFAASTAVTRTNEGRNERTTYNNPLNPPGVGRVNFFYPIKVRVSMGTCLPNLGAIRRPVRKCCLSNL